MASVKVVLWKHRANKDGSTLSAWKSSTIENAKRSPCFLAPEQYWNDGWVDKTYDEHSDLNAKIADWHKRISRKIRDLDEKREFLDINL